MFCSPNLKDCNDVVEFNEFDEEEADDVVDEDGVADNFPPP